MKETYNYQIRPPFEDLNENHIDEYSKHRCWYCYMPNGKHHKWCIYYNCNPSVSLGSELFLLLPFTIYLIRKVFKK